MRNGIIIFLVVLLLVIFTSTYTVDERQTAIKLQFNDIVEENIQPGLHFKMPWVNSIKKFPTLVLTLDAQPSDFITSEKKSLMVDFFVKWKISDASKFYKATLGSIPRAETRLENIMRDGLRNEFSTRTIQESVTGERGEIMTALREKAASTVKQLGMTIVDARVSQIDFPESASKSVYARMRSERQRAAQDFRSRGKAHGEKIRAGADRQATIIEAEAYRDAEKIRGEGDAKSAEIYAKAYQKDAEFFAFYRSLDAYKNALGNAGDVMVIEPNTEFFRYFKGQQKSAPQLPSFAE